MKPVDLIEFPPAQMRAFERARRLEWISVFYIASAALFLYLVMGTSQAMRTSWLEDMMSLVPPIAFLVCSRVARRAATPKYPYGLHSSVSVGYLTASLALLAMGGFLLTEAVIKLASGERTTIGTVEIWGMTLWAGWPMLAALAYTGIPSFVLGRAKLRTAPVIQDKILYADAEMNRADWLAEAATAVGVIGTGLGFWWADGGAAGLVSMEIVRDGARNVRAAVTDLMDETPKKITTPEELDPLPGDLTRHLEKLDWVEKVDVRMREEGRVFFGEIFVVPRVDDMSADELIDRLSELAAQARAFNWRVHDVCVMPVGRAALE